MDLLIKGARVVDFDQDFIGDVYIKDGLIAAIGKNLTADCKIIDAKDLTLLPSFVDLHTHFRDPGFTYKEDILTGSLAAAKGGYTAVNLMANTNPVCSTMKIVNYVRKKSTELGLIDINQIVSVTKDLRGDDISHLDSLNQSVKFISDDGKGIINDVIMLNAMKKAKSMDLTIISHAENAEIVNTDNRYSEEQITMRDILLSKLTKCKLHMAHVSIVEAMNHVIEGKKSGANITCEVTPHHIALTDEINYSVNPPLRKESDRKFLIKCIQEGWVDTIATDHAPHSEDDKKNGAPGISGIETSFSVCYTNLVKKNYITLNKLSELMSKRPAEMMNLNKGKISVGFDGDLVLVGLNKSYKVDTNQFLSKGKNTPFNGMELYGEIISTFKGGKIVYEKKEDLL